jgi:hypothetical protein
MLSAVGLVAGILIRLLLFGWSYCERDQSTSVMLMQCLGAVSKRRREG